MSSDYLYVHKKKLPDFFDDVLYARSLIETKEVSTITEAVAKAGISRNTYYKYKDYIFEGTEIGQSRKAVLSIIVKDQAGVLSNILTKLNEIGTSILTISQALPIAQRANVIISLDITNMKISIDEMTAALKNIEYVKSVHIDAMD